MFLKTLEALNTLQHRLRNHFSKVVDKVTKDNRDIYYALEPARKLIHIICGEDMLEKMLTILVDENRELKRFSNGKVFRRIPRTRVRWELKLSKDEYDRYQTWGDTSKQLVFQSYFGKDKIFFALKDDNSKPNEGEIDYPDLDVGRRFSNRADILDTLFSKINIVDFVDNMGQNMDVDFRSRLIYEITEALTGVKTKLYPKAE